MVTATAPGRGHAPHGEAVLDGARRRPGPPGRPAARRGGGPASAAIAGRGDGRLGEGDRALGADQVGALAVAGRPPASRISATERGRWAKTWQRAGRARPSSTSSNIAPGPSRPSRQAGSSWSRFGPAQHGQTVTGTLVQPRTVLVCRRWAPRAVDGATSGNAGQRLLEADAALHAGQGGAQAEVHAVAERDVVVERAVDVEAVGVGVLALVAPGRAGEQQHLRVGRDDLAVQLDRLGGPAALHRRRRLVAQQLLDRVGDERRVGGQLGPLVGVLVEQHRGPAEQPGHRLGAGADQQEGELGALLGGQAPDRAVGAR